MRRVLVLENDRAAGRLYQRILSGGGYGVELVETADDCLARLATERFSVLLTGYRMPGIDVGRLLERVVSRAPGTKVVIVTGYVSMEEPHGWRPGRVAAWIEKPFTLSGFLEKVDNAAGPGRTGRSPGGCPGCAHGEQ